MCDETHNRVLHDLKLLSSLRENDKIYAHEGHLRVEHGSLFRFVYRWSRGDSRIKSLLMIQNILRDALQLAEFQIDRLMRKDSKLRDIEMLTIKSRVVRLYCEVQRANVALRHLRTTYFDDRSVVAQLDCVREEASERLNAIRQYVEEVDDSNSPHILEGFVVFDNFHSKVLNISG